MSNLFGTNLKVNKNQLLEARAQNLTTAEKTTLAGSLGANDKGLFVYDTTLSKLFVWSGTAFENVTPAPPTIGQYRGAVAHTDAEPANLVSGDWVVFNSEGALTNFVPGAVVQIEDKAFYNGTTWDLVQGNVVYATETVAGIIQIATLAEAIAGNEATKAITPSSLKDVMNERTKFGSISLTANVPSTILHTLNTVDLDVRFKIQNSNNFIILDWVSVNGTTIEVSSTTTETFDYAIVAHYID